MRIAGLYPQKVSLGPQGEMEFLEPLGLEYVLAQVASNHDVKLFTLFEKSPEQVEQEIIEYKPDVLAVSAMTPQINLGLRMAREIKRRSPSTISVFGGYHPTSIDISSEPEVDIVIAGEGEEEFVEVVGNLREFRKAPNKLVRKAGRIQDLDSLADPLRPDFLERLRNYGTMYPPVSQQNGMTSVLFSRGCLFSCDFCASPSMYGQGVIYRSVPKVIAELKKLNQGRGINTFLFCDLNFTANPQKTKELCTSIVDSGLKIYWECLSNISTANDREMLNLMHRAGCRKIGWGIESLNPSILRDMGKSGLERAREVLQRSEDVGILNTGFYIIGHPVETPQDILKYSSGLALLPIHRIRVTAYTPLPGSRLYEKTNQKDPNFDLYDTTHLVFTHPNLTQESLTGLRAEITRRFYESPEYVDRAKQVISKFPEYKGIFPISETEGKI